MVDGPGLTFAALLLDNHHGIVLGGRLRNLHKISGRGDSDSVVATRMEGYVGGFGGRIVDGWDVGGPLRSRAVQIADRRRPLLFTAAVGCAHRRLFRAHNAPPLSAVVVAVGAPVRGRRQRL